jgi:ferritin-like metal-binding protein YciE
MPGKSPKEIFVTILSQLRNGTERSTAIYKELGQLAQNPEIQEALAARSFVSEQHTQKLDEVFKLIGEKPVNINERLQDIVIENLRSELAEIQSPPAKLLFILAKANQLSHLRMAAYATLVAAADITGKYGVGVLLESCLADHLAFAERTKRLLRRIFEAKIEARVAA